MKSNCRYAANYVLTDSGLLHEAMVEFQDGILTKIVELSSLNHEPAGTEFLNGTLTGTNGAPLYVGYSGRIEFPR